MVPAYKPGALNAGYGGWKHRQKGSGRERENRSFQDGAGKVQDEPRHLVVIDMLDGSWGHVNLKGPPLAKFRTIGATG